MLEPHDLRPVVAFLQEVKRLHTRKHGPNMKIYDQILSRVRAACRTAGDIRRWCETVAVKMGVDGTSKVLAALILQLDNIALGHPRGGLLRSISREAGYVIACLRLAEDQRRAASAGQLGLEDVDIDDEE